MRNDFSFFTLLLSFAFVAAWMHRRSKERETRMKLLEKALDKPGLDEALRRELAAQLSGRGSFERLLRGELLGGFGIRQLLLIAGWMGMFVGIGMLAVGGRSEEQAGVMILLMSIGVVTLPFALREFERRKPA